MVQFVTSPAAARLPLAQIYDRVFREHPAAEVEFRPDREIVRSRQLAIHHA